MGAPTNTRLDGTERRWLQETTGYGVKMTDRDATEWQKMLEVVERDLWIYRARRYMTRVAAEWVWQCAPKHVWHASARNATALKPILLEGDQTTCKRTRLSALPPGSCDAGMVRQVL